MKRHWLFVALIPIIMLTGCGSIDSYINQKITEKSGVLQDENYVKYQEYLEAGVLDEEGLYIDDTEEDIKAGSIHVTFASNNNIKASYFSDIECKSVVDITDYYTNPGTVLYAKAKLVDDIKSSVYEFAGYNMYSYSEEGNRKLIGEFTDLSDDTVAIEIPAEIEATEISIEPIGKYGTSELTFADYLIDDDDNRSEISGYWYVDDKEVGAERKIAISPISPCIVSYKYDADSYFFVSSEPECYYNSNGDGLVIFPQREATDEMNSYTVDLHKYIEVSIPVDHSRKISVNGADSIQYQADSELQLTKLIYGDYVRIETDSAWDALENNKDLMHYSTEYNSGKYIYTLLLPEKGGEFFFDPSEYTYDHGTIEFKCFGSVVNAPQVLKKGSKIYYDQKTVDEGYQLSTGTHFIVVGEEEETRNALKNIKFTEVVQVVVELKQPDYGGSIEYSIDGKRIYSTTVNTYSGKVIKMKINHWEGWMCDTDQEEYVVKEDAAQSVKVNGKDINTLFKEDDWHKPTLNVVIDDSVGAEMMVNVEASGVSKNDKSYAEGWFKMRTDYKLVDSEKIGTEKGIVLSLSNSAIPAGKALKVSVAKTVDGQKELEKQLIYVDDVTKLREPIEIYSDKEISTTTKHYKDISINISLVDISKFRTVTPAINTTIVVRNADTMEEMKNGQYVEASQKVVVTINANAGYFVTGKNVKNDFYQATMKYSEYEKDIDDIVKNHVAEKFVVITLDSSDVYASYTYKLDGKVVSGKVSAKADQKLELEYKITDDAHELSEKKGGFLGIGASLKEQTEKITISTDMDGKTIYRKDFGITVKGE